ncbi:MAG: dockerin type I domain-containing protein, partial [Lachnospiraceae bacterium]
SDGTFGGSDQYELMSGTSMAAPHIAGLAAVAAQYLKASGYAAKNSQLSASYSLRAVIQSLLMSTATPMKNDGQYVSVLQQGAGLAEVNKAIEASSVLMIDDAPLTGKTGSAADGKVKAELGDDPDRKGAYSYAFTIYNMADKDLTFNLSTDLFTQDCGDNEDDGLTYMLPTTTAINADVTYRFDGEETFAADVNKDGRTDGQDAQAILDYMTGVTAASQLNLNAADLDQNGSVTTYDAHLLLAALEAGSGQGQTSGQELIVPAGGSRQVTVQISIPDSQKEILDSIYTSGAYVEGYTYAVCNDTDAEGVSYAHTHSIPVLGFYGSWTDPSMFDNTSYTDKLYFAGTKNYSGADQTNYLTISYSGNTSIFSGNPYMIEDTFPAERLAVNSDTDTFGNIYYNLIRSAGTTGFAVSKIDAIGGQIEDVLTSSVAGTEVDGLWYYSNQRTWQNTGTKSYYVGKSADDYGLNEGDTFRLGFYAIPEYNGMLYHADNMADASAGMLNNAGLEAVLESNVLGKGAFVGYDFTIDNTDPVISSASLSGNSLSVAASDNMNLAYLAVLSLDGNTIYEQAAPGKASSSITLDASSAIANAAGYVAVFAADYAGNETAVA